MRKSNLATVILLLSWCSCLTVYSQSTPSRYIHIGAGVAPSSIRDRGMSPLLYIGLPLTVQAGYQRQSEKSLQALSLQFTTGGLRPQILSSTYNSLALYKGEVDIRYLHTIRTFGQRTHLRVGGSWNTFGSYRIQKDFENNQEYYELYSSLNLNAQASYTIGHIDLMYSFFTPLAGSIVRPDYVVSVPEPFINQKGSNTDAFFRSNRIVTFHRFLRLNSGASLQYHLKTGNAVCLNYTWDFYKYTRLHVVKASTHMFVLTLKFKL